MCLLEYFYSRSRSGNRCSQRLLHRSIQRQAEGEAMKKKIMLNTKDLVEEIKSLISDDVNNNLRIVPDDDDPSVGYMAGISIHIHTINNKIISFNKFKNFAGVSIAITSDQDNMFTVPPGVILDESQIEKLIDFLNSKLREMRQTPMAGLDKK